jgi:hypothetical protein
MKALVILRYNMIPQTLPHRNEELIKKAQLRFYWIPENGEK